MEHVFHKCNKEDCFICNGGLSLCVVCGRGEVELQPECPGKAPTRIALCLYCGKSHTIPGDDIGQRELIELMRQHDIVCEKSPFNVLMSCGHPYRYAVNAAGLENACAICLGSRQADDWDRFWEAMDVLSADITVDDAIAKYKVLGTEIKSLRFLLNEAVAWMVAAHGEHAGLALPDWVFEWNDTDTENRAAPE